MNNGAIAAIVMSAVACSSMAGGPDTRGAHAGSTTTLGFAVVELFTSEGCSSCPPADKALMELVASARHDGSPVYALSFHVDYWNRLGWKDPFSAPEWSERQRVYSTRTGDNVYTPQCVVNGTKSFVGSDAAELDKRVHDALAQQAMITVRAHAERGSTSVRTDYAIGGDITGKELVAVLVEDGLSSEVRAGENGGRHLAHTNVVRALKTTALHPDQPTGSVVLDASGLHDPANAEVILFVQQAGQGAILAATSADFAAR